MPGTAVGSVRYGRIWSFAVRTISAPITPMKSAPCGPNWSFATSQGSWLSGGGNRSGSGASGCAARSVDPPCDGIAGVPITPVCLGLLTARRLAVGIPAGSLPTSHSRVRPEPPATDGARSLPGLGHRDDLSSSSRLQPPRRPAVSSECLGHFWRAEVGHFWKAPKVSLRRPRIEEFLGGRKGRTFIACRSKQTAQCVAHELVVIDDANQRNERLTVHFVL